VTALVEIERRLDEIERSVAEARRALAVDRPARPNAATTDRLLVSVPEGGRLVGLGRTAAFEAARRGDLPTVEFAGQRLVPISELRRMVEAVATSTRRAT